MTTPSWRMPLILRFLLQEFLFVRVVSGRSSRQALEGAKESTKAFSLCSRILVRGGRGNFVVIISSSVCYWRLPNSELLPSSLMLKRRFYKGIPGCLRVWRVMDRIQIVYSQRRSNGFDRFGRAHALHGSNCNVVIICAKENFGRLLLFRLRA